MKGIECGLSPGELLDYFKFFSNHPQDFPAGAFPDQPEVVLGGLRRHWAMISTRRLIKEEVPDTESRRELERKIREECHGLRESLSATTLQVNERANLTGRLGQLGTLHHLSVTADQAELCAQAFVK